MDGREVRLQPLIELMTDVGLGLGRRLNGSLPCAERALACLQHDKGIVGRQITPDDGRHSAADLGGAVQRFEMGPQPLGCARDRTDHNLRAVQAEAVIGDFTA